MKIKNKLLVLAAFFALAIPLVFTAQASALYLQDDGSKLQDNGQWMVDNAWPTGYTNGAMDGCLGCHSGAVPAVDIGAADYFRTGHKNVLRKVTPTSTTGYIPLGGPAYTDGSGSAYTNITWATRLAGTQTAYYVYNGWYVSLMEAKAKAATMTQPTSVSTVTNYSGARSCFYCHTGGYKATGARYPTVSETMDASVTNPDALAKFEIGITCVTCHKNNYAEDHHTDATAEGLYGTAICLNCHRLEVTSGPISDPAIQADALLIEGEPSLKANHSNLGAQFLNSPHARFTGSFTDISDNSKYSSTFTTQVGCSNPSYGNRTDCVTGGGTWGTTTVNAGCTGCHDPHVGSVDPDVLNTGNALQNVDLCASCHTTGGPAAAPKIVVADIRHPQGTNAPQAGSTAKDVQMACVRCHMGGPIYAHLFKINTTTSYATMPAGCSNPDYHTQFTCTSNSAAWSATGAQEAQHNLATGFVEMDVRHACGWCHFDSSKVGASKMLDVDGLVEGAKLMHGGSYSTANCAACHTKSIAHPVGSNTPGPMTAGASCQRCHTQSGNTVHPYNGVAIAVCQTCHDGSPAPAYSAGQLATMALDIHGDLATTATFTISGSTAAKTFTVTSTCSAAPCEYDWFFGDSGTPVTTTSTSQGHTYTAPGTYTVKLRVTNSAGVETKSVGQILTISGTAAGTAPQAGFTPTVNGWVVTVADFTTTDSTDLTGKVLCGYPGVTAAGTWSKGGSMTCTYTVAGTYYITQSVKDNVSGLVSSVRKSVTVPTKYQITGRVMNSGATAPIGAAALYLVNSAGYTAYKTSSDANGLYTFRAVVPANNYRLDAMRGSVNFGAGVGVKGTCIADVDVSAAGDLGTSCRSTAP